MKKQNLYAALLLAGINLQQLELTMNRAPELKSHLKIAKLRLGYSWLGLLRQQLKLSEVFIEGLQGEVSLTLAESVPPPEAPPAGLGPILELIRHPPLELAIDSIEMRDTKLALHLVQGSKVIDTQVEQADFRSEIFLRNGLLDLVSLKKK